VHANGSPLLLFSQGNRARGTGLPCVANHEQYFGFDIEDCLDSKPWCLRPVEPAPNPLFEMFNSGAVAQVPVSTRPSKHLWL
jgi:hypothetical protein